MVCVNNVQTKQKVKASRDMIDFLSKYRADCMQTEHMQPRIQTHSMGVIHCAMR